MNKIQVTKWKENGSETKADGLIRVNTNKPEYGGLMLVQTSFEVSNGFINKKNRVAFINGEVEALESLISEAGLKNGDDYCAKVGPHKIVTIEKVQSEVGKELGYSEKINPKTNEVLSKEGEPIYRKTLLVAEGSDLHDTFLTHDIEPYVSEGASDFIKEESEAEGKVVKTI